jgi:WD40 repeat protein
MKQPREAFPFARLTYLERIITRFIFTGCLSPGLFAGVITIGILPPAHANAANTGGNARACLNLFRFSITNTPKRTVSVPLELQAEIAQLLLAINSATHSSEISDVTKVLRNELKLKLSELRNLGFTDLLPDQTIRNKALQDLDQTEQQQSAENQSRISIAKEIETYLQPWIVKNKISDPEGNSWVYSGVLSPDQNSIFLITSEKRAASYNVITGQMNFEIAPSNGQLTFHKAIFSPDGTQILTFSEHKPSIDFWDATNGSLIRSISIEDATSLNEVSFDSKDHKVLFIKTGNNGTSKVESFDSSSGMRIAKLTLPTFTNRFILKISPNGQLIAITNFLTTDTGGLWPNPTLQSDRILIFNSKVGKLVANLDGHSNSINSIEFSSDSTKLITASEDKTARIWDLAPVITINDKLNSKINRLPRFMVSAAATWNTRTRKNNLVPKLTVSPEITVNNPTFPMRQAMFAPDNQTFFIMNSIGIGTILEAATGKVIFKIDVRPHAHAHKEFESVSTYSHNGKLLAISTPKGDSLQIWNTKTGALLSTVRSPSGDIRSISFTPDDTHLITTSKQDCTTYIWERHK